MGFLVPRNDRWRGRIELNFNMGQNQRSSACHAEPACRLGTKHLYKIKRSTAVIAFCNRSS